MIEVEKARCTGRSGRPVGASDDKMMRITAQTGSGLSSGGTADLRGAMVRLSAAQRRSGSPADRARAAGLDKPRPGGSRKLSALSVMLRKRDNLNGARDQLRRMQELVRQAKDATTDADQAFIREQLGETDTAFRAFAGQGGDPAALAAFTLAGGESGNPGRSATLAGDVRAMVAGRGEYVIRTMDARVGGLTLSGSLLTTGSFADNSASVSMGPGGVSGTYTLTSEGTAETVSDARGTLELGGSFDGNSLVSVVRTGAAQGAEFRITKEPAGQLELENLDTGVKQVIAFAAIADQTGVKTLDFDQLGVTISLTGPSESTNTALASALDNLTIGSVSAGSSADGNSVTAVTMTGVAAGTTFTLSRNGSDIELQNTITNAKQRIDIQNIAGQAGAKVIDFDQLGVQISLTGAAESGNDALAKALDDRTLVASAGLSGAAIRLTHAETGTSQLLDVSALAGGAGAKSLNFSQLGVTVTLTGDAEDFAGELALALNGSTITATTRQGQARQVMVTDTQTGIAQTLAVTGTAGEGGRSLDFDALGLSLEIGEEGELDLDATLRGLQGVSFGGGAGPAAFGDREQVDLFAGEASGGRTRAEFAGEIDVAMAVMEGDQRALEVEIRGASRELGRNADGTGMVSSERNAAAVLRQLAEAAPSLLTLSHRDPGAPTALRLLG